MAEILRLRKTGGALDTPDSVADETRIGKRSIQQAQRILTSRVGGVLSVLEGELARVAELIDIVRDPDVATFLGEEHARLTAAVCEAKLKLENFKGRR